MARLLSILLLLTALAACTPRQAPQASLPPYPPADPALHDTIARLDSLLFAAYNHCQVEAFAALISDDIEFYHDQGGLTTSKPQLLDALRNNICGKVHRELLAGSIEVYPIAHYGAVQLGLHRFINLQEHSTSRYGRFVHTWRRQPDGGWQLARVISLH